MAEATLLRTSAIVRNASVGTSPPHGPVKVGELSLVQVKPAPGGPQVQGPQHRPVEILPPRDTESALRTGGLPMVNVKMTSRGPQLDDGQMQKSVVILPPKGEQRAVAAGGLPMIQVKMTSAGPQVQSLPNVQSAPPQIQSAAPALSQPRTTHFTAPSANQPHGGRFVAPSAHQPRVARIAAPSASQPRGVGRVAAPQQVAQVPLPPVPEMSTEQLMLCHHRITAYLNDLVAADNPTEPPTEAHVESDVVKLARETIANIDQILVATALRAEAAALAAAASTIPDVPIAPVALAPAVAVVATVATVQQRSVARSYVAGGGRSQRNSGMAPRRVSRPGSPLPPVVVKMDGQRPVVQNKDEVAAARVSALSVETVSAPEPIAVETTVMPESAEDDAQG